MAKTVRRTLERELKLAVEPGFELPQIAGKTLAPRVFTSTYHDTADRRLLDAAVTLRRRVEQRRGAWQLKLPSSGGRLELEAPGRTATPELMALLVGVTRGRPLEPVATLRTRRTGIRTAAGNGGVADVTVDAVSVLEGRRTTGRFAEVEIELVSGDPDVLDRIGRELRRSGARRHDGRPKLARALEAEPRPPPPDAEASPQAHFQAMLAVQDRTIVSHDPGVRLGADPEDLHQLRVATRRFRALLRAARGLVDESWSADLRTELAWFGGELGPVRNLDVLVSDLAAERESLDQAERLGLGLLVRKLDEEGGRVRGALADAMNSERYFSLLDTLELAADAPPFTGEEVSLAAIAQGEFRKLRRAVNKLPRSPDDEELHAVRIRGKRARYSAELAEPTVGKAATRFVRRAKDLQDLIGDHQDAVVMERELRRLMSLTRSQPAALAAGRLIERQQRRKAKARRSFAKTWSRLDEAGRKAWR
jgi:CHAD domain-containing protein